MSWNHVGWSDKLWIFIRFEGKLRFTRGEFARVEEKSFEVSTLKMINYCRAEGGKLKWTNKISSSVSPFMNGKSFRLSCEKESFTSDNPTFSRAKFCICWPSENWGRKSESDDKWEWKLIIWIFMKSWKSKDSVERQTNFQKSNPKRIHSSDKIRNWQRNEKLENSEKLFRGKTNNR